MSFYDDYVADGLACMCCGEIFDDVIEDDAEPGYPRACESCGGEDGSDWNNEDDDGVALNAMAHPAAKRKRVKKKSVVTFKRLRARLASLAFAHKIGHLIVDV